MHPTRGNEVEQIGKPEGAKYSPKWAMAELRHSSSLGSRASSSPLKRDGDLSPLVPDNQLDDDDERDRDSSKDRDRSFLSHFQQLCPFFNDDARVPPHNSRISLFLILLLVFVGLISIFSVVNKLVSPPLLLRSTFSVDILICNFCFDCAVSLVTE